MLRSRLFTTASSLDLSGIITDETGTGSLVFSTSPIIITPTFTNLSTFNGQVNITDATASTSTTTGALRVAGGVGVGGALNVGGNATINGASVGIGAGTDNTLVGVGAGASLESGGNRNVFIGKFAGDAVTTGDDSVAVGYDALGAAQGAIENVAIGKDALRVTTASENTAVGAFALSSNTGSGSQVAIGQLAGSLISGTGSNSNTFIGHRAGRLRGTGTDPLTAASNSIFIGADARPLGNAEANQIVIGQAGRGNGSNTTTIGNSSTTGTFIPAGNLTLSNGNLILASGNGIDFSDTGQAANVPARNAGGITGTATAPSNNDTVTVGASVYTFKTALTPADGEVLIGASSQTALTNLANAINGTGGTPGTDYQVAGANASATAAYIFSTVPYIALRAITAGAAGNSIALSETSAQLSVETFAGGADAVTNPTGELLNDYEEGTWNPVLEPTTGAFDMVTMRVHEARYIKVGRMVTVFGAFNAMIVNTTGSGLIRITGLPYAAVSTVAAGNDTGTRYTGAAKTRNWSSTRPDAVMLNSGDTVLRLANQGTGDYTDTTTASLDQRPISNRQYAVFTISYPAA